jgi:hypothetical protein
MEGFMIGISEEYGDATSSNMSATNTIRATL